MKVKTTMKTNDKNWLELWRGPSVIDGHPVVLLAQLASRNSKIGGAVGLYIWSQRNKPSVMRGTGGMCPKCPIKAVCYNQSGRLTSVYDKSWAVRVASGRVLKPEREDFSRHLSGRLLRWGVDGDIGAVPLEVIRAVNAATGLASGHLAYTHHHKRTELQSVAMASTGSFAEAVKLEKMGWRCYLSLPARGWNGRKDRFTGKIKADFVELVRTGKRESGLLLWCSLCPNYTSGLKCSSCKMCDGLSGNRAGHIVAPLHGPKAIQAVKGGRYAN